LKPTRPTKAQRKALLLAYGDEYELRPGGPGGPGPRERTLEALVAAGWLRRARGRPWSEAVVTDRGREALRLSLPPPADLRAALREALDALLPYEVARDAVIIGDQIPRLCLDEEADGGNGFWLASDRALAAVERGLGHASAALDDDGEDEAWAAVEKRLGEAGFPVELELRGPWMLFLAADVG
jgi:hypothetical protein